MCRAIGRRARFANEARGRAERLRAVHGIVGSFDANRASAFALEEISVGQLGFSLVGASTWHVSDYARLEGEC
jgi:hypothetical protein